MQIATSSPIKALRSSPPLRAPAEFRDPIPGAPAARRLLNSRWSRFARHITGVLILGSVFSASSLSILSPSPALAEGLNESGNEFEITSEKMSLKLRALSDRVIQVQASPGAKVSDHPSFVVSTDKFARGPRFEVQNNADDVLLSTSQLKVKIVKSSLRLVFLDNDSKVISEDLIDNPMSFEGQSFRVWKSSPDDEHYFGMGDKTGPLDRRNQSFTFWTTDPALFQESTDPLYKSIPFMLAMRGGSAYGIYLDNTYRSYFDMDKSKRSAYCFGAEGGSLDYYFFYGPDPKKVIENYTALTGRMPLPPMFSLGYQQSRGSYFPDAQVRQIAKQLRDKKIPTDVMYFDGDYKQDGHPFKINQKYFPDFPGLVAHLSGQGFKSVLSVDPYVAKVPGEKPYDEGLAQKFFVKNPDGTPYVGKVWPGDVCFADFTNAKVRKWWGTLHSDFVKAGVRGIWDDMNEPAVFNRVDRTMPLDVVHDVEGRKTDHREVHNVYGMQNTRATYDGLLALNPKLRPFVLTRSGFAGSQKYAATWTGDNTSTWNHMRISVPQLLNLGVSGYTFAGADIGGFNGFSGGPSPELLTRWMQLGAFNPLFRNHSDMVTRAREPWVDGPKHEAIRKHFIEERYKLLPYIYTCMEESARTGIPLMRPMFLEFPQDESLTTNGEQFMFGGALLVAPRLWDIGGTYPVRLPPGTWYDYWTGKQIAGDQTQSVDPKIDAMPIYARGGSIIPKQGIIQHTGETPTGPLEVRVYLQNEMSKSSEPSSKSFKGEIYFDDGENMDYKSDKFFRSEWTCNPSANVVELKVGFSGSGFQPRLSQYQCSVFGLNRAVKTVKIDGKNIDGWSVTGGKLTLPPTAWSDSAQTIAIGF